MLFKRKMKARYKEQGAKAFSECLDIHDNPYLFAEGYFIRTKIKWWEYGWKEAKDIQDEGEQE